MVVRAPWIAACLLIASSCGGSPNSTSERPVESGTVAESFPPDSQSPKTVVPATLPDRSDVEAPEDTTTSAGPSTSAVSGPESQPPLVDMTALRVAAADFDGTVSVFSLDGLVDGASRLDESLLGGQKIRDLEWLSPSLIVLELCCAPDVGTVVALDLGQHEGWQLGFGGLGSGAESAVAIVDRPVIAILDPAERGVEGEFVPLWTQETSIAASFSGSQGHAIVLGVNDEYWVVVFAIEWSAGLLTERTRWPLDGSVNIGQVEMDLDFSERAWLADGSVRLLVVDGSGHFDTIEFTNEIVDISFDTSRRVLLLHYSSGELGWFDIVSGEIGNVTFGSRVSAADWAGPSTR